MPHTSTCPWRSRAGTTTAARSRDKSRRRSCATTSARRTAPRRRPAIPRSPAIDCSAAVDTRLRFQSWLTVEGNAADQARVLVNGNLVYRNPLTARNDKGWGAQELDLSAFADHNSSVTIEFQIRSNGAN